MPNSLYGVFTQQSCEKQLICQHLSRLLSTRKGSLVHVPEYGLPDVLSVFRYLPYSLQAFSEAIHDAIALFEPRLSQLEVRCLARSTLKGRLCFKINACYQEEVLAFKVDVNRFSSATVVLQHDR